MEKNPTPYKVSAVTALVEHICLRSGLSPATTSHCKSKALEVLYGGGSPAKAVREAIVRMADIVADTVVDQVVANYVMQGQIPVTFTTNNMH